MSNAVTVLYDDEEVRMAQWLLSVVVYGVLDFTALQKVCATLLMTHFTIVAVTVYLHRHQSHCALSMHPSIAHLFRLWLWLTTGMITKEWVAVHRKHHAYVEMPADPHSPQVHGISNVLWRGAELYRDATADETVLARFGQGTPDDWLEKHLYSRYPWLGISVMFGLDLLMFGLHGISIWAVQMMWIPLLAAGVVNGLGHWWGYRNFETADASSNLCPWGVLIGGEELHNNHHAFPSSARLSSQPWEFDIGWCYIQGLEYLGLAKVRKLAPMPTLIAEKQRVDLDSVRAIIRNHMHVMAHYARDVVVPVHRDEHRRATSPESRQILKRTRGLLLKEESRLDDEALRHLHDGLTLSESLQIVYNFKRQLKALWRDQTATHDVTLQGLTEWCQQAEDTGIHALRDFARTLRRYTLQKA